MGADDFLGTADSTALHIATNGQTRLEVAADGKVVVPDLSGDGLRIMVVDSNGTLTASELKLGGGGGGCSPVLDGWGVDGAFNNILHLCGPYDRVQIGSTARVSPNLPAIGLDVRDDQRIGGNLVVQGLTGAGGGIVFVDADGKLTIQPQTTYSTVWFGNGNQVLQGQNIGSNNAEDLILKANGQERLRLAATGGVSLPSLAGSAGPVYVDANGRLTTATQGGATEWSLAGNAVNANQFIGTTNAQALVFKTNGTERFRIASNGVFSINRGTNYLNATRFQVETSGTDHVAVGVYARYSTPWHYGVQALVNHNDTKAFAVVNENIAAPNAPDGEDVFVVYGNGHMHAKNVKVHLTGWSDYVFEEGYALMPLRDVEAYIAANGHLPGIPSAEEVLRDGDDLGAMDARLLAKIEELTLHVIAQEKELAALRARMGTLGR